MTSACNTMQVRMLTKANFGEVSEMDVALSTQCVQCAGHTVAVEADEHAHDEED